MPKADCFVILHNIRSAHNVGAIFRTADAVGVSKIYLTGYTPAPFDRFGRVRKDIAKSALGSENTVPWEKKASLSALIRKLKREGVEIAAVEQASGSVDYKDFHPSGSVALIFGNEVKGLEKGTLAKADRVIELPMRGKKESLNVAVCAGVVLYRLLDM